MVRARTQLRAGIAWSLAAAAVLLTAAPAWAAEGGGSMGDLGQAIAALAIFAVLMGVLGKWAWGPIVQQLKQREEEIAERIRKAETDQAKAAEAAAASEQKLTEAESKAQESLAEARKDAAALREQMLQSARAEAGTIVENARKDIEQARRDALGDIRESTARLAGEIAAGVLAQKIQPEEHQELIDLSLKAIRDSVRENAS